MSRQVNFLNGAFKGHSEAEGIRELQPLLLSKYLQKKIATYLFVFLFYLEKYLKVDTKNSTSKPLKKPS